MNKIALNIRYKTGYQFNWVAWYLVIYVIIMFMLSYALIKTSLINISEGSLVYRLWASVIWQFAIAMRFKEDFDFFLTLSNTRKDIFLSQLGVVFGFSAFFSGLIVLERLIVDHLNNVFGYHHITDPFHFFAPYGTDNLFLQFVFFLVLCVCCSLFGLLMGSLFYRFGKKFTLTFWLVFSSIPIAFFPLLILPSQFSISLKTVGECLRNFDVLVGSGVLFILTIVFSTAAYLNIRRLPQK
ncbi:hypothetical protein AMJ80_09250 [bacterium SM23_31]|nr:MAG: hypothetical protein AMJ80_09250 [bacterium SM23_31]